MVKQGRDEAFEGKGDFFCVLGGRDWSGGVDWYWSFLLLTWKGKETKLDEVRNMKTQMWFSNSLSLSLLLLFIIFNLFFNICCRMTE